MEQRVTEEQMKLLYELVEENHPKAAFSLGILYLEGEYVEKNEGRAVYYLKKAALLGHAEAMLTLGEMHEEASEFRYAKGWYQQAAAERLPAALFALGQMEEKEENHHEAYRAYYEAMQQEVVEAIFPVWQYIQEGLGTEEEREETFEYLVNLANEGNFEARRLAESELIEREDISIDPFAWPRVYIQGRKVNYRMEMVQHAVELDTTGVEGAIDRAYVLEHPTLKAYNIPLAIFGIYVHTPKVMNGRTLGLKEQYDAIKKQVKLPVTEQYVQMYPAFSYQIDGRATFVILGRQAVYEVSVETEKMYIGQLKKFVRAIVQTLVEKEDE